MKRKVLFACVAIGWLVPAYQTFGQERPVVAVFDLEDRGAGIPPANLENLTQLLSVKLAECGYQVVPRDQIKERLRQQQKESYQACYDESCQIELGREIAAQKTLSAQVLKIGAGCQLGATLYDLKKAAAEAGASASGECSETALLELVEQIKEKICQPLEEALRQASERALSSYQRVLKETESLREQSSRQQKVWQEVSALAGDENVPAATRAELIRKFMEEFKQPSPLLQEAQQLLRKLVPGRVSVVSVPTGALISLNGKPMGVAPLKTELPEGKHLVVARLEEHRQQQQEFQLESGAEIEVRLELERIYPMNPYKKWGHVAFWSGLGIAASGAAAYAVAYNHAQDNKAGDAEAAERAVLWRGISYGLFGAGGAAVAVGAVLWLLSPGDQAWFERHRVAIIPLAGGSAAVLDWRW